MESSPQMIRASIATLFLLLSIVIAVVHSNNPNRVLGKWPSTALMSVFSMGAAFSVITIWSFCAARGLPSRLDTYGLAASISNAGFYTAAALNACVRSVIAMRKRRMD